MSQREIANAKLSQQVAEQGMVLLKNTDQVLPLKNKKVALYGSGAFETYKGGTGSGDVNQRRVINIEQGLLNANFEITSQGWLRRFNEAYQQQKKAYYQKYGDSPLVVLAPAFSMDDPQISDFADAETGIYVISRSAGEGQDRKNVAGDYQLTENELVNIQTMSQFYKNSVVLLNVGGVIDTSFIDQCPLLDSVLLISQAGMNAGSAVANVLTGKTVPSGKLTDTWAYDFKDYYSSNSFGQKDPNYQEGIYVGYRYFDSFNVKPRFEFGYGLSYTKFFLQTKKTHVNEQNLTVQVDVENIGEEYSGAEVVQMYVSNPQTDIPTPYQSLQAFKKTQVLKPGQMQTVTLTVPTKNLAVFDERLAAWVLVPGIYRIRVGNSSQLTNIVAEFKLDQRVVIEQLSHKLLPEKDPTILRSNNVKHHSGKKVPFFLLKASNFEEPTRIEYTDEKAVTTYVDQQRELPGKGLNETVELVDSIDKPKLVDVFNNQIPMENLVAKLSDSELVSLVEGTLTPDKMGSIVGNGAQEVPGAAGQTVKLDQFGIPETINADGPAGLRIDRDVKQSDDKMTHQYATAWPIGTLLAQSWDPDLIYQVGKAVGIEMKEFGITMWLAPGMNIHRNPLGGRNFEYFAEDPVLSGVIAAAEVNGVQSNPGIGVTIKHFLGNNQETLRNTGDSIIGEQALREIYLKNFEIAVKESQPMAVMSSYNKINGTFAGENFESLTNILRDEWNFQGLVMTDWYSLADPVKSMHAGNDLIMPGGSQDKLFEHLIDLKPEFDEDGIVKEQSYFDIAQMKLATKKLWHDFEPDHSGQRVVKIEVGDDDHLDTNIEEMILDGTAQVISDHSVIISGHYKDNNDLYIGDLQKSVANILKVVMKTDRFAKLIDQAAKPYSFDLTKETYFTASNDEQN